MRGSTPGDIVLFALVVTFVPALLLLAIEVVVELVTRRDAAVLHCVFLGFLGAVFGVQALKRSGVDTTVVLVAGAIAIGVALAVRCVARADRADVSDDPVGGVADLPRDVPVRLAGRGARLPGDREGRGRDGRVANAGRLPALRRVPRQRPADREESDRREAVPELRAARAHVDVVQEHDDALCDDDGCGAGDPDGQPAGQGRAARRAELPAQPLHAARGPLPHEGHGIADAAVPGAHLRASLSRSHVAPVVALLGRARRLPAPALAAVARGAPARDRRVLGELRLGHRRRSRGRAAEGEHPHLLYRASPGLQQLRRLDSTRRSRPTHRRSTSCTC